MLVVRRNTGQNYTISTTASKAPTSLLKWAVFYQINKMVRLRNKYKCDWSVMLVKLSNHAERALHAGRPQLPVWLTAIMWPIQPATRAAWFRSWKIFIHNNFTEKKRGQPFRFCTTKTVYFLFYKEFSTRLGKGTGLPSELQRIITKGLQEWVLSIFLM